MSEAWRRASSCSDAACIEVQFKKGRVKIRSSAFEPAELVFTDEEWRAFITGAKAGEFDREVDSG